MGEFTMDITPVGMKTPEGIARVNKAMRECENARAEVANKTHFLLQTHFETIRQNLVGDGEYDAAEDLDDIKAAITDMLAKQDEFMKAVAGR
jgi:hypothetical protein